jgi:hypothetical protein
MESENDSLEHAQDTEKLLENEKKHRKLFLLKNDPSNDELESNF